MLPHLKEKVKAIKPSQSGAPDKRVWLGTTTGEYTNKSGYQVALKFREKETFSANDQHEIDWFKSVWKLNISPKVKFFLWKVFQNAIHVGELLAIRNIDVDIRCKRCNSPESINHLFIHCPYARKVWESIPVALEVDLSRTIDLSEVWLNLCGKICFPPTGLAAGPLVPWILWQLWISRNSLWFSDKHLTEGETVTRALKMAKECTDVQEKKTTPQQKKAYREPFPPNCSVLRTAAAWRASSQQAGFGWTIEKKDLVVSSFSTGSSVGSALVVEAMAMRQAVQEARKLGHKRLVCEADSLQFVKALNDGDVPLEIYSIVADIFISSIYFEVIAFGWIPRSMNAEADSLAK